MRQRELKKAKEQKRRERAMRKQAGNLGLNVLGLFGAPWWVEMGRSSEEQAEWRQQRETAAREVLRARVYI